MNREELPCYSEIVTLDTYKLRSLKCQPDVIFDIGANLGMFTTFARELFPNALIVAVEPHPPNFAFLTKNTPHENAVFLEKAIGRGQILRYPDIQATDESQLVTGETYISSGSGYELPDIADHPLAPVATRSVMLDELYAEYAKPGDKFIVKIDCEGAENVLFVHPPSVEVLKQADFVTMELHPYWATRELDTWAEGQPHEDFAALAKRVESMLAETHDCEYEPYMFYAWRRPC